MISSARGFQGWEKLINALGANDRSGTKNLAGGLFRGCGIDPEAFSRLLFQVAEDDFPSGKKGVELASKLFENQGDTPTHKEETAASFLLSSLMTIRESEMSPDEQKRVAEFGFGAVAEALSVTAGDHGGDEFRDLLRRVFSDTDGGKKSSRFALASVGEHMVGKAMQNVEKGASAGDGNEVDSNIVKSLNSLIHRAEKESLQTGEASGPKLDAMTGKDGKSTINPQTSNGGPKEFSENGSAVAQESGRAGSGVQTAFPFSSSNGRNATDGSFPEQAHAGAETTTGIVDSETDLSSRLTKEEPSNREINEAKSGIFGTTEENNGEKGLKSAGIQNFEPNSTFAKESGGPNANAISQTQSNHDLQENAGALKTNFQTKLASFSFENESARTETDMANQIFVRLFTGLRQGSRKMVIDLHPPELGRVKVDIYSDKGGLKIQMHPQNDQVVGVLEKHLPMLQQSLENQGVSLSSLQVGVESGNHQASQFQGQGFGASGGNQDRFESADKEKTTVVSEDDGSDPQGTGTANGLSLRV